MRGPVADAQYGKDERQFPYRHSSAGKAEREGETTLWLRDSDHTLLASATFSVTWDGEAWQLVIGGLQGPATPRFSEVIKAGDPRLLRSVPEAPAAGFIWLLAARSHIAAAIYGVSDNGHVFRALRYRLSKGRHFPCQLRRVLAIHRRQAGKPLALAATAASGKKTAGEHRQ